MRATNSEIDVQYFKFSLQHFVFYVNLSEKSMFQKFQKESLEKLKLLDAKRKNLKEIVKMPQTPEMTNQVICNVIL